MTVKERSTCLSKIIAKSDNTLDHDVLSDVRRRLMSKPQQLSLATDISKALQKYDNYNKSSSTLEMVKYKQLKDCSLYFYRPSNDLVKVQIIQGVDAMRLGEGHQKYTQNAIQQVASQFNFLESQTSNHTPISACVS